MFELTVGQRMFIRYANMGSRPADGATAQKWVITRLTPKFAFVTDERGHSNHLNRAALETWGKFTQVYGWTWFTEEAIAAEEIPGMTEEQFLAEFIALRDQLPRGSKFVRRRGLRWPSFCGVWQVSLAWDGTVTRPPPLWWPDMGAENKAITQANWLEIGAAVRAGLLDWLRGEITRTRGAIVQGAATRAQRLETKLQKVTDAWLADDGARYAGASECVCCKKALTDPESVQRGIGPECWEHIVQRMERARASTQAA